MQKNNNNGLYIFLTIVLLLLTVGALYKYSQLSSTATPIIVDDEAETATIEEVVQSEEPLVTSSISPVISVTKSPKSTLIPEVTLAPTPTFKTLANLGDKFSVVYKSFRTVYEDKEGTGNRYTLYSPEGNIAIHIGQNWSWTHPDRTFTSAALVSGNYSFTYDTGSQTITDFESTGLKYTIQCVHGGKQSLKDECIQLLKDFKTL